MKNLLTDKYLHGKTDEYQAIVTDMRESGLEFLLPDINKSGYEFTIEGENVRVGFLAVKGLGEVTANYLLSARQEHGDFTGVEDIYNSVNKTKINKKVFTVLIFSKCLSEFGDPQALYREYYDLREEVAPTEITISKDLKFKATVKDTRSFQKKFLGANYTFDLEKKK